MTNMATMMNTSWKTYANAKTFSILYTSLRMIFLCILAEASLTAPSKVGHCQISLLLSVQPACPDDA